jgi:multicomponent Na+:H+ antiporter subunit F
MSSAEILELATTFGLAVLTLAILLSFVRLVRGPSLADRIMALDTMTTIAIGYIAIVAIRTGIMLYLDVAIALGLVGFLSTVALTRYLLHRFGAKVGRP